MPCLLHPPGNIFRKKLFQLENGFLSTKNANRHEKSKTQNVGSAVGAYHKPIEHALFTTPHISCFAGAGRDG